jgi:ADP-heptose:LPS heptosyltransferase
LRDQLIPEELLLRSRKILFITHLAIGDFTYLQNYFLAFSRKYPHLKVDLWIDEVRRTWLFWRWKHLKTYALYDWVEQCPCFNKIYRQTYSPPGRWVSLSRAQDEDYPIVITLTTLRPHRYARLARFISSSGFIVGMVKRTRPWKVIKNRAFGRLDGRLSEEKASLPPIRHVTDMYSHWFERLCGLRLPPDLRRPFIPVSPEWMNWAEKRFPVHAAGQGEPGPCRRMFVNPYAKDKKRCWPLPVVYRFLSDLKRKDGWNDTRFIINTPPESEHETAAFFRDHPVDGVVLFTAADNFFQLPAVVALCDIVVSVETSVMHIASSLHVPTVALMRRKNPEWAPWNREVCVVITCRARNDWIEDISAEEVIAATDVFRKQLPYRGPRRLARPDSGNEYCSAIQTDGGAELL